MHRVLAVMALLLVATPARADCEVRGVASIDRLRVRIEGQRIRTMSVQDTPVGVRPGRGTRYRDVRVLAPLEFGARTDASIPWTVPRPGSVSDGLLWLTPRTEIEQVREQVDRPGLVVRAQVDVGVWVDRVRVPCSAIAVGHGEGGEPAPAWADAHGPRWALAHRSVWLRSALIDSEARERAAAHPALDDPQTGGTDDAPTLRLSAPHGLRAPLVEVERRAGWVRVVARFPSGAALRGWVRPHHLRAAPEHGVARPPYARAIRPAPYGLCRAPRPSAQTYVGPARLSVGAAVRSARDGVVWGTISEPALFTVAWRQGAAWVQIVHAPGLRGDGRCAEVLESAWVARRAVILSGE